MELTPPQATFFVRHPNGAYAMLTLMLSREVRAAIEAKVAELLNASPRHEHTWYLVREPKPGWSGGDVYICGGRDARRDA